MHPDVFGSFIDGQWLTSGDVQTNYNPCKTKDIVGKYYGASAAEL